MLERPVAPTSVEVPVVGSIRNRALESGVPPKVVNPKRAPSERNAIPIRLLMTVERGFDAAPVDVSTS